MSQPTFSARRAARALAGLTVGAVALVACGSSPSSSPATSILLAPKVVVTSVKGDPKSELLAAIYARLLEDAGLRVSRKDPVDMDRAAYLDAIEKGDFQLIPDFTGDLLHELYSKPGAPSEPTTVVPDQPATTQAPVTIAPTTVPPTTVAGTDVATTTATGATTTTAAPVITNGRTVAEQLVAIRAVLPETVTVGNPAQAEVKTVLACTEATMKANKDTQFFSYTSIASAGPTIRLGGSAAWMADKDFGYPAFQQYYGGDFKDVVTVEDAGLEAALAGNKVDCVAIDSMNPLVTTQKLTILDDDKSMVKGNAAVPLIATKVATADVIAALDKISVSLTSARLNQMLNQVVAGGTDPVTVANAFMDTLGSTTG
ncbi:MAG: hypothetical protein RJA49_2954 [Actinomycetota bacterium]